MKYLIILSLFLVSCSEPELRLEEKVIPVKSKALPFKDRVDLQVIVIDSCEYLSYGVGGQVGILTHKGNCKYCLERQKLNSK